MGRREEESRVESCDAISLRSFSFLISVFLAFIPFNDLTTFSIMGDGLSHCDNRFYISSFTKT